MQEEQENTSSTTSTYRFRADDCYQFGTPIGRELESKDAYAADIQTTWEHIRDKEKDKTSRFVSFSLVKIVRHSDGSIGGPVKFTKKNKIIKIAWEELQKLEKEGRIKIYQPSDVANHMRSHAKKKVRKDAENVKSVMEKNAEILVEGQIPAALVVFST